MGEAYSQKCRLLVCSEWVECTAALGAGSPVIANGRPAEKARSDQPSVSIAWASRVRSGIAMPYGQAVAQGAAQLPQASAFVARPA